MRTFEAAAALLLAALPTSAGGPVFGRAPYDAAGPPQDRISVSIDASAARQILDALSEDKLKPGDASALMALDAVRRQIADSGQPDSQWVEDFAAAFDQRSRPVTFDLRSIRLARDVWRPRLAALVQNLPEIERQASRRADALIPADVPVALSARVELTFGIAGLADHLVVERDHGPVIVVDLGQALASALGDEPGGAAVTDLLSRLAAAETFRAAWAAYRSRSPAWSENSPVGPAAPLLRAVAAQAPVALFAYNKDFFPLATWLNGPMLQAVDSLNQDANVLLDSRTPLGTRAEILARLRSAGLQRDPALAAGAFLADGVFQKDGRDALLRALAAGPAGLFRAYAKASRVKGSNLPPLLPGLESTVGGQRPSG